MKAGFELMSPYAVLSFFQPWGGGGYSPSGFHVNTHGAEHDGEVVIVAIEHVLLLDQRGLWMEYDRHDKTNG